MKILFLAIPALIACVALGMAVSAMRERLRLRAAWRGGLTAEAHCRRTYATTGRRGGSGTSTTLHHVYEFTARDGRTVRFEEEDGPATTLEGDIVVVSYAADHPERATAQEPGTALRHTAHTVGLLLFCAVMVAFCVFFATSALRSL
ncbi:DUF3592 domain-containing protein [Streptomyces tsukubensis]|uniref:DUF3592 domain-containing protein n=1 Tax=Streptomyces tsukubensis TaxID=83656 RepID=A0A1V4A483_9ACTN|nr:DUF3592 domain-containing protein [Streptomyces tsukubensis]OON75382.1 hypothetical protein B1H18_23155 [Streptomyces tsukubensis]QFR94988.1 hypothetical protein GBW32_20630 [Streptomyces tsukubensis]